MVRFGSHARADGAILLVTPDGLKRLKMNKFNLAEFISQNMIKKG
jgi:hypothetical protein